MGDDWRYDSWTNSLGWMDTYGSSALFKKVLDIASNKDAKEEIARSSEKLDKLKAEETEQRLALLDSALNGEADPVVSLKLAQLEQDIAETQDELERAEYEKETTFQDTLDIMNAYLKYSKWRGEETSDGWVFTRDRLEEDE